MDKTIQEILEVERAWVRALRDLDLAAMDRILADEYAQVQENSKVIGKGEFLATFQSGERHWDYAESVDHDIRVYGEAAVMIAVWKARGVNHGEAFDYQARFLAVYIRRDGRWQLAADESATIRD